MGNKENKLAEPIYEDKNPNYVAPYTDELKEMCRIKFSECHKDKYHWDDPECIEERDKCMHG